MRKDNSDIYALPIIYNFSTEMTEIIQSDKIKYCQNAQIVFNSRRMDSVAFR
jgi:hypothetical protein